MILLRVWGSRVTEQKKEKKPRKKQAPRGTPDLIARIVAESDLLGDEPAIIKNKISRSTLVNYQKRVKDAPVGSELANAYVLKKRLIAQELAGPAREAFLRFIGWYTCQIESGEGSAYHINGGGKIIGDFLLEDRALKIVEQNPEVIETTPKEAVDRARHYAR